MNATLTIGAGLGGICILSTKSALRMDVFEAAVQAGIERFVPARPPMTTILRDSMKIVGESLFGRRRKQPISVRRLDAPSEFECVRVVTQPGTLKNRYDFLFSATIHEWQPRILSMMGGGPTMAGLSDELGQAVAYRRLYLPGPIVSQVVTRGLKSWGALSMSEHGGVWFLDGQFLPQYRAFANHLRGNGTGPKFTVHQVEIASDPDTVAHVLDLLGAEVSEGVQSIMDDVMNAQGGMSDRSVNIRIERANTFLSKVQQYESLLGRPLPELVAAIEQAKQAVAVNRLLSAAV